MIGIARRLLGAWIIALVTLAGARAEDWRTLVQPIGTLLAVEGAAVVNERLGGKPPFAIGTDVTTVQTSVPLYFVRFFNPTAAENPSSALGSWVMRSATVRGLPPEEVRQRFALPSHPAMMTLVLVPSGSKLYTGIAAPIEGWGSGGAQQSKLIGPPWVPAANFMNQQVTGNCILCYRSLGNDGVAGTIARFLDARIPAAYSDLERVYENLDRLYFAPTAGLFRHALEQISPVRYNALAEEGMRIALMHAESTEQQMRQQFVSGRTVQDRGAWLYAVTGSAQADNPAYRGSSFGLLGGSQVRLSTRTVAGFSAAIMRSEIDWVGGLGRAQGETLRLGVHGAWTHVDWIAQASLTGGYSRSEVTRRLSFAELAREARSSPHAADAHGRLAIAYRLPIAGMRLLPVVAMDYDHRRTGRINERGADSLNLSVASSTTRRLRTHAALVAAWDLVQPDGLSVTPQIEVGWAHLRRIGSSALTARLDGATDELEGNPESRARRLLTAGASLLAIRSDRLSLQAAYRWERGDDQRAHWLSASLHYCF